MQLQGETDDLGLSPSFNCYFSDHSLTASAAAKVISELNHEHASHLFEFSDADEDDFEFSSHTSEEQISDDASSNVIQLQKSSVNEHESNSSSEADESECNRKPTGIFCMWRPLIKKRSSTGSGLSSRRIWNSLRQSHSDGKSKEGRRVNGKLKTTTSLPASPSFHELFYMQKRAEQKGEKMKSFLPYKQDLLGFFVNRNRFGNKKLLF